MEGNTKTCLKCRNLRGCRLLRNRDGSLAVQSVVTEDSEEQCPEWIPTGSREYMLRKGMVQNFGLGAVRAIHALPSDNLPDEEETEHDMIELEQLRELVREDMTRAEREEYVRYATDESGEFIVDVDGNKVPRRALIIRKYATDVLDVPNEEAAFLSIHKLVKRILKLEAENKWIAKNRPKKTKQEEPEQPQEEKKQMPRVVGRKSKGVAVKKNVTVAGKSAAKSKVSKPVTAKKSKPKTEEPVDAAPAAAFDTEELVEAISKAVHSIVEAKVEEAKKELMELIDAARGDMVTQHTNLHDALMYKVQLMHTPMVDEDGNPVSDYHILEDPEDGLLANAEATILAYEEAEEASGEAE